MKVFGVTHQGKVRKENQDSFRLNAPANREILTAVLCDGMGGARGGSIASSIAADTFMYHAANSLDESSTAADLRDILTSAVNTANKKVYDKSFSDISCMGMGSTLVALIVAGKRAFVANVGDSRAYLISGKTIRQITNDHSLVADMLARGKITPEEARSHPQKNIITRAVGVEAVVKSDLFEVKLPAGGWVLLCSDGLSNLLTDAEMRDTVKRNAEPETACSELLETALSRGAPDNVTVLLVQR